MYGQEHQNRVDTHHHHLATDDRRTELLALQPIQLLGIGPRLNGIK